MGKSKKKSHKPKSEDTNQEKLYLLHMNLCGPMRVESVNGKKYILVIVDDYSRFTWVKCLRSKDEAPDFIIKFLKMIQVRLKVPGRQAVATASYTQNCSIVCLHHDKTPYELLHSKLPELSFLHVFGALCYPTNDSENLGKLQPTVDIVVHEERVKIRNNIRRNVTSEILLYTVTIHLEIQTIRLISTPSDGLKLAEESKAKSFVEEPPELELKELPSHLEYAFLEDSNKFPVIIAKNLKDVEKEALINVLKSHKRAVAWKIFDIKGIDPRFYTHKILMEDDYKPAVQSQRPVGESNPLRSQEGRKLNDATRKDHFPLPFMDQMLRRLAGNEFYCFLDGFLEYFQIPIDPQDQEKTTFTCPYGTFTYRSMPFGLCNAPGHKISKSGIEVDRAKVDVIAKLPHPTTVKGVRSFLGHAGFYRRFIQDFSKISRPMTHLLEKETHFVFFKECIDAFNTSKKNLTKAPILVVPDWNFPFELMCDASDYAIGSVLGQCKTKHFQPIHYASKTMTEAQIHYTTTEKEMLAVVYAFEKFRPYLVLSKSIVYTDHSALKYLLNKQDAKPTLLRWGIDFMGPFPSSKGKKNILVAVDYLSKWVEAKALPTNDARVVVKFLKSLFSRF
nr:hypothetical protein [Tanacetum cinerariifolium]